MHYFSLIHLGRPVHDVRVTFAREAVDTFIRSAMWADTHVQLNEDELDGLQEALWASGWLHAEHLDWLTSRA